MVFESLPENCIDEIVGCFGRFVNDESAAPGRDGKREFLKFALENTHFLPADLQQEIDKRKNGSSVADYLFSHVKFRHAYGVYRQ
ncbi:hypothetical protein JW898_01750 [Candidatus Woesearchaeota archaeon]|nr:hypothetical protein [Candidatus Woesearchaeota archaeon]